ncbi:MAG: molybdopterin molybdenumtransferase MoeA, partial [Streptomyces sp.]|nr:molybdopterin molybdenumtransferase MoeA [Streptomyces sp.]
MSATSPVVVTGAHMEPRHGTPWADARERAHALGAALPTSTLSIPLADANGLVLRESVRSRTSLPPHAASAMDGWVVAGEPPWAIGTPIDAGDAPDRTPLIAGTARPICTGAPLPPGAVGVLRLENGCESGYGADRILHRGERARPDEPRAGEHVRPAAEEARAGELLIASGSVLTPPRIALAAAGGHDALRVAAAPGVDLLVLGNELAASGVPPEGSIRDVVTPAFPMILASLGARVGEVGRAPDDRHATTAAMAASDASVLIVTGGSSRGRTDHARAAAASLGVRWVVDGVAMRPGHPVAFGHRPDGRIVLLLPGNP